MKDANLCALMVCNKYWTMKEERKKKGRRKQETNKEGRNQGYEWYAPNNGI